jgi:hypothetical protein
MTPENSENGQNPTEPNAARESLPTPREALVHALKNKTAEAEMLRKEWLDALEAKATAANTSRANIEVLFDQISVYEEAEMLESAIDAARAAAWAAEYDPTAEDLSQLALRKLEDLKSQQLKK